VILTAGRLWDEAKNVKALCSAAPQLSWPVYVAGDQVGAGQDPHPLPNVRHLGRLEAGSMEAWLSRASIYALPAKYEPFGLSVLEAAMGGCALVLGDIASLRENWDGAAVFVPPDDTAAITGTLRRLIDDSEARSALGAQALARARRFTPDRMTREYQEAYADASAAVAA
jgi:glycosyltransferase involved in cell wall biosynthesis